jgi:hypothetical protein
VVAVNCYIRKIIVFIVPIFPVKFSCEDSNMMARSHKVFPFLCPHWHLFHLVYSSRITTRVRNKYCHMNLSLLYGCETIIFCLFDMKIFS